MRLQLKWGAWGAIHFALRRRFLRCVLMHRKCTPRAPRNRRRIARVSRPRHPHFTSGVGEEGALRDRNVFRCTSSARSRFAFGVGGLAISVVLLMAAGPVMADEASGTWTGTVEARGNYFWERSTRVIVPTFKVVTE